MDHSERHHRLTLESYLSTYFRNNQGVRLGETTVISYKVHGNDSRTPGEIRIYIDQDAGRFYLKRAEDNIILHMDVFHEPATLDGVYVARRVLQGVENYFVKLQDENRREYTKERVAKLTEEFSKKILVKTASGQGNIFSLSRRESELIPEKARLPQTHVHLLFPLESKHYDLLVFIADAVEQAVLNQGFEIRRVEKIIHCEREFEDSIAPGIGLNLPGFNSPEALGHRVKQTRLQIIMDLANAFGSIEEAARFLESLTKSRNFMLGSFAKKHQDGNLKQTLLDLSNMNLIKQGKFSALLTEEGKALRDFIREHQKELEAQVRKSIRRYQIVRHDYRTFRNSELKSKKSHTTNYKKVVGFNESNWMNDIAVPETVISAAARSYLEAKPGISIDKTDLKIYGKKSFAPIDTCIAIDGSGSMVGEKIRAVNFLAEHFLLTSKERVSVVLFQETDARVVVPFTKNYQKLRDGLETVKPEGMTPLAKGIVESVNLIKKKRARNPLLILITDGIPNHPLWSMDSKEDALKAAQMIAENKIRLVCIGVLPNEKFMKELASLGKGNLYVVEELDRNSLLDVVTQEWMQYKGIN